MTEWFESIAGPGYVPAMMWTIGALVLLLIVLLVIKIVRNLTFGTFVAGGRTRKTRLAVMDATAVDSQRRLVLVRRDDVEHLILVGGPTDVVVEQNIRLSAPSLRPQSDVAPSVVARETAAPQPSEPQFAPVRNSPREDIAPPPQAAPQRTAPEPFVARPTPAPRPLPPVAPPVQAAPSIAPPSPDIDDSLLNELEETLDRARTPDRSEPAAPSAAPPVVTPPASPVADSPGRSPAPQRQKEVDSLDDEMTRLLGEIRGTQR